MSKCFWSYNYRLITTVQQHGNLQLIVASQSQVDQLWQHVVTHSNPVCPHKQTTVAKYPFDRSRGGRRTISRFVSDENRVFMVASPKTKTLRFQDQDRDRDSRVPRPRPRLWGSKTKTETKTCKNGSRDVSRPRLKSRELQVCLSNSIASQKPSVFVSVWHKGLIIFLVLVRIVLNGTSAHIRLFHTLQWHRI